MSTEEADLEWGSKVGRPGFDPTGGDRPGVVEQPTQRFVDLCVARRAGQISVDVLDGCLQAIQRALEIFQPASVDDHIVVAQPVGRGELPGDVGLLATPLTAKASRAASADPIGQAAPAPPAPLLHR